MTYADVGPKVVEWVYYVNKFMVNILRCYLLVNKDYNYN